ncbi:MAG: hypothetical protein ABEI13_03275, partial [Candidatus Paceibacteria bacterium]
EWLSTGSKDMEYNIDEKVAKKLNNIDNNTPSSVTQSRIVGSAILYFTKELKLGEQERRYDRLLKQENINPNQLQEYPDSVFENMEDEASKHDLKTMDEFNDVAKMTIQVSLPSEIRDIVEKHSPHYHAKSYWISNVLDAYLNNSRYKSRYERLRTKQQVLDIITSRDLQKEEWTRALNLMNDYKLNVEIAERLWGAEDSPFKLVRTQDIIEDSYTPQDKIMIRSPDYDRIPEGEKTRTALLGYIRYRISNDTFFKIPVLYDIVSRRIDYTEQGRRNLINQIFEIMQEEGWSIHIIQETKDIDYMRVVSPPEIDLKHKSVVEENVSWDVLDLSPAQIIRKSKAVVDERRSGSDISFSSMMNRKSEYPVDDSVLENKKKLFDLS